MTPEPDRAGRGQAVGRAQMLGLLCGVLVACGNSADSGGANDAPCGAPPGDWLRRQLHATLN